MKELGIFAGIGGFSLGLKWAGFETVAFCEIDKKCQLVLKKHWPNVPIYGNVKELTYERLKEDGITEIDIITGGFPCQDISLSGKGAGITGPQSGLWKEYSRLIGEVRPKYAIMENVSALLNRGLSTVLGDLAEIGYDAEWHCLSASTIGAPHNRDRIWIIAYPSKKRWIFSEIQQQICLETINKQWSPDSFKLLFDAAKNIPEPDGGNLREDDGFSITVDRLGQLGNAVVPQIPYIIGMAIMEAEKEK